MYALDEMRGVEASSDEVRLTKAMKYPLSKYKDGSYKVQSGERLRVNMTSDTFLEEADEWRDEMWDIIRQRPDVIFWLLTKRPERIMDHLPEDWDDGWENVMINITCENQAMCDLRVPILLSIPAKHKGICAAPLIGSIDFTEALSSGQIEEISCGGENYNNPRPCRLEWVQRIAFDCRRFGVNFCWYETGTNFWVGDKNYWISTKQAQAMVAYVYGLNQRFTKPEYKLHSCEDGHLLSAEERHEKVYNLHHCVLCSNQDVCNGCSGCGTCGPVKLISKDELISEQLSLNPAMLRSYVL
jgi:protein gp37